ncbi:hypothetical protein KVR01_003845 [Diaporthe batatas]|uniref:uncharacterized protein n=1 Tax=Diaporthe batatas TaxID=748121 RepID=UPI001D03FC03|nr:uncharacterized protein KVR01_003845 [Diaporthe batatas]KAG8168156.1 hypothetical protein KVR01_003845 [Diaporthe batatas]
MAPQEKKTVLITGCSDGGIGAALAKAFHNTGRYHVIATARNPSKMKGLVAVGGIETLQLDVTSQASIDGLVPKLTRLDVLVNNAGAEFLMPVVDIDIAKAKELFDLNVWAHLAVTQALTPLILQSKGLVVNHTSVGASTMLPWQGVYTASKAALMMLSDTLRLEMEPFGVQVVDLRTAVTKTNLIHNHAGKAPTLPKGSIYEPAREVVEKALRQEVFVGQGMDVDEWARLTVRDLSKKKPPPVIWRGESATMLWFATFMPFGYLDGFLKKLGGLDIVEKIIKA